MSNPNKTFLRKSSEETTIISPGVVVRANIQRHEGGSITIEDRDSGTVYWFRDNDALQKALRRGLKA